MYFFVKYMCVLTFVGVCYSKDLHIKEDLDHNLAEKDHATPDIYINNGLSHLPERERFVRHVEMTVTETVLQHLMNEINKKYPETRAGAKNSTMPKLIRRLKSKLRKQINKNKNIKHRKASHSKAHAKISGNTTSSTNSTINNVV